MFQIPLPAALPPDRQACILLPLLVTSRASCSLSAEPRPPRDARQSMERQRRTTNSHIPDLTTGRRPWTVRQLGRWDRPQGILVFPHPALTSPSPMAKFLGRRGSPRAHSRTRRSSCESVAQFRLNLKGGGGRKGSQGGGQNFLVEERVLIHIPRRWASASSRGPGWGPRFQENSPAGR